MALTITPEVFVDLMRLCLGWEWERGLDRQKATHNREQPLYPTQVAWTTVDKIARILCGLGIITKKQRSMLYKDRRLQYLVLHNAECAIVGDSSLSGVLRDSRKDFLLQCDPIESVNREKMLRNMRFYTTEAGRSKMSAISAKYAAAINKKRYFAEIEKQAEELPQNPGGVASLMTNYRKKVEGETKRE